jgi:hypothetical protein
MQFRFKIGIRLSPQAHSNEKYALVSKAKILLNILQENWQYAYSIDCTHRCIEAGTCSPVLLLDKFAIFFAQQLGLHYSDL